MAAFESLREHWLGVGTELIVRATRSICDGSVLNADHGRAATSARIEEWSSVLPLYQTDNSSETVRFSA
ncbi:hypothetical protein EV643_13738 [Kribbella sp. VKM Ac-2527]|uniref:Uncharacterized protein n=1 Tax=Kribbella caucasensis TaxID=2512215 RepID=A0A4R6J6Y7_9ACTN|nr:hypothetical protein [Kribbella sp. VKM Ac-2527]TDO30611.1 hypothetical protein EV643_13738 [Kribbella sp. VKM Ac-2527]